jgi:maleate isomerase
MTSYRTGLIVPSSNVTVETEMPALLNTHPDSSFSFHSSRMRMKQVSPAQLAAMNAQRERCVLELGDARPDVILYGCLVALMVAGPGEHERVESLVAEQLATGGSETKVRSSAGALVETLHDMGAKRIAVVTPYMKPLAQQVVDYLEAYELDVVDWRALEVEDNSAVGCIPGEDVITAARSLDLADVDVLVLSACVQMPSLPLVERAEAEFGVPVITAATAGAYSILRALDLPLALTGGGALLRQDSRIPVPTI